MSGGGARGGVHDRGDIPDAHASSVDCAAAMDIVRGFADGQFNPRLRTRRDQMSSFVVRLLTLVNG